MQERYAFGEFVLDVSERRLTRGSDCIALAPKVHDVLVALVRHAGRLVTKHELLELVWPGSFVEEGILAVHVSGLRKALGDVDRQHRYIETVSRSGYRFIAAVERRTTNSPARAARRSRALLVAPPLSPIRPEAYELFGRGREYLLSASMFDLPKAVEAFRAAIALEPTYAAAHAGLALAWCAQADLRVTPYAEAYAQAKTAALRSLALDDSCGDAQLALGTVLFLSEWDWIGAERSFARALELNPNYTEAYLLYGRLLEAIGQLERGLELKLKALERDPLSPLVLLQISLSYWNQRRYDDSIDWAKKALALDPQHLLAREHLAAAYWKKGDVEQLMMENIRHAEAYGVASGSLASMRKHCDELTAVQNAGGRPAVVRYMIEQASRNGNGPAIQLAILHGEAGELDAAFRHLHRAIDGRDPCLVHLAVAPQWDSLRTDPRFGQCLTRLGLGAA